MINPQLEGAYRRTHYCVDVPGGGRVVLRIGEASAEFDVILRGEGVGRWVIVAAVNPRSVVLSDEENALRHRDLVAILVSRNLRFWPATNEAPEGGWPPEPSVCILDISTCEALQLAAEFGQVAIVFSGNSGVPVLEWVPSK